MYVSICKLVSFLSEFVLGSFDFHWLSVAVGIMMLIVLLVMVLIVIMVFLIFMSWMSTWFKHIMGWEHCTHMMILSWASLCDATDLVLHKGGKVTDYL